MFQRHNETCNIWTHLVGLAIFVAITCSMAFDWGRHRLPRLPDTWTFGDESFDATRRAIYRHLRDFASAAEDTRRALVDATETLRRGIGDSKRYRAWVESGAKNVMRDASSSMTSVATHLREHLRLDGGANVDALRRTLDDAVGAMRHAVHGLEHDAVEALNAEVAKLYAQVRFILLFVPVWAIRLTWFFIHSWTRRPRSSQTRMPSAWTSSPRRGGRCTRSSPGRSRASG